MVPHTLGMKIHSGYPSDAHDVCCAFAVPMAFGQEEAPDGYRQIFALPSEDTPLRFVIYPGIASVSGKEQYTEYTEYIRHLYVGAAMRAVHGSWILSVILQ